MKTLFITIFQGIEFRNIVRTDIYRELIKQPDTRLVLFTNSDLKRDYYQKEFSAPNVIYEVAERYRPSRFNRFFWFLKFNLINTVTLDIKRRQALERGGRYWAYWLKLIFNRLFARRLIRKIVRWLDYYLARDRFFAPYFEKYRPSAVLLAHLFSDTEIAFLKEAKRRGIYSVGLINSWDKLTARCMIRQLPDLMVVHNEIVKRDAMRYADMPENKIAVVGIPHFDFYATLPRTSRTDFYKKFGIDPKDRILLYTPVGRTNSALDAKTISLLDQLLISGRLPSNLRLIVRFPPNDDVEVPSGFKNKIIFQTPGKRFSQKRGTDWDMSAADFQELAETLQHCSLVISYSSTMVIDAAVFDKPIINLDFDFPDLPSSHWIYEVAHYRPVLESGAIRLVKNTDELVEWINRYLDNPAIDGPGRARLIQEQCGRIDGKAGKRVVDKILENRK
jgi:hypothetical protein